MKPALLDRFVPIPDVRERFETTIRAPADVVMQVAADFDMQSIPSVRAIIRLREALLGARKSAPRRPPGRFVICGARCQPWLADVTFSALGAREFASYAAPDQVKIAWTLEADPVGEEETSFAQETRAAATDAEARRRFRRYWRWARFGIVAIRLLILPAIRREAERRWTAQLGQRRG